MSEKPLDLCVRNSGMTKAEIAKRMGVTKGAVNWWRVHGIPRGRLKQLSEITGVPERLLESRTD